MRFGVLAALLSLTFQAHATPIGFACPTGPDQLITIAFDDGILQNQEGSKMPEQATVSLTFSDQNPYSLTTKTFMELPVPQASVVYAEFRDFTSRDLISLEIAPNLQSARTTLQIKSRKVDLSDLNCVRQPL